MAFGLDFLFILLACIYGNVEGEDVCQANDLRAVILMIRQVKTDTHASLASLENKMDKMNGDIETLERANCEHMKYIEELKAEIRNLTLIVQEKILPERRCKEGWLSHAGSCYLFANETRNFTEAKSYCERHNSTLVHVNDESENNFCMSRISACSASCYWLGLTDSDTEGEWRWVDTNELLTGSDFSDWYTDEPNGGEDENCADLFYSLGFKWNDLSCARACVPICELK